MDNLTKIAECFQIEGKVVTSTPYGNGHINSTFKVETDSNKKYILQKINTSIFKKPQELMENIENVTDHLRKVCVAENGDPEREVLTLIKTVDGKLCITDDDGSVWRMYVFITDTFCLDVATSAKDVYLTGLSFGRFTGKMDSFPADSLFETILNFHNTPSRYNDFENAVKENKSGRACEVKDEIEFVRERKEFCKLFTSNIGKDKLPLRVTHNDTKLNNILFDAKSNEPITIIDLDTVMPGLSLYDYGDALRTGAATAAEDEKDLSLMHFDLELFRAFTKGYLEGCGKMLTELEIKMLPYAAKMLTLECGIRFLADHIAGDVYFKIHREGHNLDRCRTQFKLVEEMEQKQQELENIVNEIAAEVLG